MKRSSGTHIKVMLLFVWASWLTIVFITNLLDGLKSAGILSGTWAFASGNYQFLTDTTARYGNLHWLPAVLFAGVVAWEGLAALAFWRALLLHYYRDARSLSGSRLAFAVSLALWGAFMLADEIFIVYAVEGTHIRIFTSQLVTLLVVELLPERE